MAMPNSTTCKDSATSRDPGEIAEALKMLNLDTDINSFQDSIDDFGDMRDDFWVFLGLTLKKLLSFVHKNTDDVL